MNQLISCHRRTFSKLGNREKSCSESTESSHRSCQWGRPMELGSNSTRCPSSPPSVKTSWSRPKSSREQLTLRSSTSTSTELWNTCDRPKVLARGTWSYWWTTPWSIDTRQYLRLPEGSRSMCSSTPSILRGSTRSSSCSHRWRRSWKEGSSAPSKALALNIIGSSSYKNYRMCWWTWSLKTYKPCGPSVSRDGSRPLSMVMFDDCLASLPLYPGRLPIYPGRPPLYLGRAMMDCSILKLT